MFRFLFASRDARRTPARISAPDHPRANPARQGVTHHQPQDFPSFRIVASHSANPDPTLKSGMSWAFRSAASHRFLKNTLD
jgi:hypothetical protein